MSLVVSGLKTELKNAFEAMASDTSGDNRTFAKKVSKAVADYAESGSIGTTDAGAIPGGVFVGSGNGSISVQSSIAENIIYAACVAMITMTAGGNAYLAAQMGAGIQAMITAGIVTTTVAGTCTPPAPATPFPTGGTAKGTLSCVAAPLVTALQTAFESMVTMTECGNEYLAGQIATAVDTYLKAGNVSTSGLATIQGSSGSGTIA